MGRRKIEIKPIRDDRNRSVTFLKRKGGLFKKAHELSVLCSVDVAVIIFGHNKKLYEYSSSDINEIIGRFQYYGGAHEHKGPQDYAEKGGGDDDDDDDEGGEGDDRGTPQPEPHQMMGMQQHPGFQHVRHGTPGQQGSPPMHNGAMPQFQRGPSPLPPGHPLSRPASRQDQHQGHVRRTSSNLVPPQHQQHPQGPMPQPNYAYTPNPPFYNPQAAAQMQRPQGPPPHAQPPGATYPPPYPPQGPPHHPQMQQVMMQDNRRSSMPPAFPPQPPPQPNMQRHPSQEHLQPPQQGQQQPQRQPSPRPQQQQATRPTPSPQPQQQDFTSPPLPQPKPLPAHAKSHSIFTPIDDSRSMLARNWGSTSNAEPPRSDAAIKVEGDGPRSHSIDVAAMQREREGLPPAGRPNGVSPRPPPARHPPNRSPQPPQRTESAPGVPVIKAPTRSNTNQSDAKRPRLALQIPSEQSDGEGDDTATAQPSAQQPDNNRVVLPPPSPSAGALLSAGAQGPPNPFARPAPPMSTNPHALNRDPSGADATPISALPSRFMSDNLLPSPSTFYPEWGFGRGGGMSAGTDNMLPSPLNFQTPVVGNGGGPWREEEDQRKRHAEESALGEGEGKKPRI